MNENSLNKKLNRIDTAITEIRTAVEKDNIEIENLATEVQTLKDANPYKYFYYGKEAPDPTQYKYWLDIDTTKEQTPIKMTYSCSLTNTATNISNGDNNLIVRKPTRDINMNATTLRYHLTKDYVVLDDTSTAGAITTTTTIKVSPRLAEEDGELFFNNKYIRGEGEERTYVLADLLTDLYVGDNNRFFLGSNEKYNDNIIYIFYPTSEDNFKYVSIDLDNEMNLTVLGSIDQDDVWIKNNGYFHYARSLTHIDASTFIIHVHPTSSNLGFSLLYEFTISNGVITKSTGSYDSEDISKSAVSSHARLTYLNKNILLWDSADYTYTYPGGYNRQNKGYDIRTKQFIWDAIYSGTQLGDLLSNAGYKLYSDTSNASNVRWFDSNDSTPTRYGVAEIQKKDDSTTARGLVLFKTMVGNATTTSSQRTTKNAIELIIEPSAYQANGLANGSLYKYIYSYNPRTKTLKFIINGSVTVYAGETSSTKTVNFTNDSVMEVVLTYETSGEVSSPWTVEWSSSTTIPSENSVVFSTRTSQYKLYTGEDAYYCVYFASNRVPFYYNNKQAYVKFYNGTQWTTTAPTEDRNIA